ncbi:hypothetical protein ABZR86_14540 [Dyella marensis]|uniref:hypothetical protein n=1 Tax=Dyella TaxID=231454 RepID=UPI00047EBF3A|nr:MULTISPECIES: hypothetical protein [Dyella]
MSHRSGAESRVGSALLHVHQAASDALAQAQRKLAATLDKAAHRFAMSRGRCLFRVGGTGKPLRQLRIGDMAVQEQ